MEKPEPLTWFPKGSHQHPDVGRTKGDRVFCGPILGAFRRKAKAEMRVSTARSLPGFSSRKAFRPHTQGEQWHGRRLSLCGR